MSSAERESERDFKSSAFDEREPSIFSFFERETEGLGG
jgi:hypothetical protein